MIRSSKGNVTSRQFPVQAAPPHRCVGTASLVLVRRHGDYQSLIVPTSEIGSRLALTSNVRGNGRRGNQTSRRYRPDGIFLKWNLPSGRETTRNERPNLLLYKVSRIPPIGVFGPYIPLPTSRPRTVVQEGGAAIDLVPSKRMLRHAKTAST
jgi:hypothetical protein